ncbi:MAG: rod shape-determining protein MreC [Verrucomicrobiota bacterium]
MRDRSIVVWVLVAAVLLTVLNLPPAVSGRAKGVLREAVAPIQSVLSGFSRKVRESVKSIRGIGGLLGENQKMAAELAHLRNQVRDLEALEQENTDLRQQLQFASRSNYRLIPCEVIARDITGWWRTVRLGKGSSDDVTLNTAVVTTDGLVGRTADVSLHTCDVLLISDPGCKVSAQIARTGSFGIVSGRGASAAGQVACQMDFINKNTPILAGDEVVTSGLGGVFPKGLLVGYVDKVYTDESGLFQKADIIPKADVGALSYVFVVAGQGNPIDEYLLQRDQQEGAQEPP